MFNLHKTSMSPNSVKLLEYRLEDLPFDDIFKDKLRISFPILNENLASIIEKLQSGKTKSGNKYIVDLQNKSAYREIKTQMGTKKQIYNLGKIISSELSNKDVDEYSKIIKNPEVTGKSVILSRAPIDILRMSDHEEIQSCHSEDREYFHAAIQEALSGGIIAYSVNNEDLQKVNLQDKEIFTDTTRGIKGISPLSRVSVGRYGLYGFNVDVNDDVRKGDFDIAIPILKEYGKKQNEMEEGKKIPGFFYALKTFLTSAQQEKIDFLKAHYDFNSQDDINALQNSLVRFGRNYDDTKDHVNLNNFFDTDLFDYLQVGRTDYANDLFCLAWCKNEFRIFNSNFSNYIECLCDEDKLANNNVGILMTMILKFHLLKDIDVKEIEKTLDMDGNGYNSDLISDIIDNISISNSIECFKIDMTQNDTTEIQIMCNVERITNTCHEFEIILNGLQNFIKQDYKRYEKILTKIGTSQILNNVNKLKVFNNINVSENIIDDKSILFPHIKVSTQPYLISRINITARERLIDNEIKNKKINDSYYDFKDSIRRNLESNIENGINKNGINTYQKLNNSLHNIFLQIINTNTPAQQQFNFLEEIPKKENDSIIPHIPSYDNLKKINLKITTKQDTDNIFVYANLHIDIDASADYEAVYMFLQYINNNIENIFKKLSPVMNEYDKQLNNDADLFCKEIIEEIQTMPDITSFNWYSLFKNS